MESETLQKVSKLIESAELFYSGKKPILSDKEYDELEAEIMKEDPSFNVKHHVKALIDLADIVHSAHFHKVLLKHKGNVVPEQLLKYGSILTPKYDGSSIVVYYKDGAPYKIVSRGNDEVGKNQTEKLANKIIKSVDPRITEVFYEAMTKQREKSNGLVNSKYKQEEVNELLTLVPWGCYSEDPGVRLEFMSNYVRILNEESQSFFEEALATGIIDGYPIDGLVSHNILNHSIAIGKIYYVEKKLSKVIGIEKNFSWTTGLISGVVFIEPTYIDGALIRKVKVGTVDTMMNLGTGVGAEVEVVRSGRVIPHIIRVVKPSNDFSSFNKCVCGHNLVRVNGSYMCTNEECSVYTNWLLFRFVNILFGPEYTRTLIKDGKLTYEVVKEFVDNNKNLMKNLTVDGLTQLIHVPGFSLAKHEKESWTNSNLNESMINKIKSLGKYLRTYSQLTYYTNMIHKYEFMLNKLEVK